MIRGGHPPRRGRGDGGGGVGVERGSVRRSSETRTDNEQKLWFDKKRLSLVA